MRSVRDDGALLRAWLLRCALAELIGIALAGAVGAAVMPWADAPGRAAWAPLAALAAMTAVGFVEGGLIGLAQGSLLHDRLPRIPLRRLVLATGVAAAGLWVIGMTPSLVLGATSATDRVASEAGAAGMGAAVVEPPLGLVLALSALGGALGGWVIGVVQRRALGPLITCGEGRRWVVATVVGWTLGLPLDMVGATLPDTTTPRWLVVLSAAGFGLLAGAAFALPTGLVARRLGAPAGTGVRGGPAAAGPAPDVAADEGRGAARDGGPTARA